MKTIKFLALALSMSFATTAYAQQNNAQRNNNAGLLPLPQGISRLIAVDAQNTLLAETDGENGEPRKFFGITVRHVYAGGIARLFGGEVIPTAPFVSPYFNGNNGFNNNNNGGFNGGNNNFNNGGFNNGNNLNGGGFNNQNNNFGNNNFGNNNFNNFNNFNGGNTFNNGQR